MPKITLDDLRNEYEKITGKKAAVNWNKATIQKKMKLFLAEKQIDAEINKKTVEPEKLPVNPAFEAAIDNEPAEILPDEPVETRGGFREGAGRPVGQTDERSRCERLMKLEKPDLAVQKIFQGLNLAFGKATGVPFTFDEVDSIALGVTLPLYYWFPSMEGRAGVFTLHCQALENIGIPFVARNIRLKDYQQKKELEKQNEQVKTNDPGIVPGASPVATVVTEKPVKKVVKKKAKK